MTRWSGIIVALILVGVVPFTATADDAEASKPQKAKWQTEQPMTPLADVLNSLSKKTGRQFAASLRVPAKITLGGLNSKSLDYAQFLQILENNNLAAVTISGVTRIIPVAAIRQQPTPVVDLDNTDIADGEWVTAVIDTGDAGSAFFVPMLRPLLPASAHLAAFHDDGILLISDRYANVKRIAELVAQIREKSHQDDAP